MIVAKFAFPLVIAACLGGAGYTYYVQHTVEVTVNVPQPPPPIPVQAEAPPVPKDWIGSVRHRTVVPHSPNPYKP